MGGIPSRGGPPESISENGTVCLLKSVFHPLVEMLLASSSSWKFGSDFTTLPAPLSVDTVWPAGGGGVSAATLWRAVDEATEPAASVALAGGAVVLVAVIALDAWVTVAGDAVGCAAAAPPHAAANNDIAAIRNTLLSPLVFIE